jgi:hypothetical protein
MKALPETVRSDAAKELDAFCEMRDAGVVRDHMRLEYEFRGKAVTLVERRIPLNSAREGDPWTRMPIARFRYDSTSGRWTLPVSCLTQWSGGSAPLTLAARIHQ